MTAQPSEFDPYDQSQREHFARQNRAIKIEKILAELDRAALIVGVPRLAGKRGAEFFCSMTAAQVRALYQAAGVRPGSAVTVAGIVAAIRERAE